MNISDSIVSFVIRTRDVERDLQRCLDSICLQKNPTKNNFDIIVVDNESNDNTISVARSFNANIITITHEQFTWGKALNMGIERAKGEFVILISADVNAKNDMWLTEMLTPFQNKQIAAVYAKQIPRVDAPIDERIRLAHTFPDKSILFDDTNAEGNSSDIKIIASNACAAIRKSVWNKVHYDELIEGGEEVAWTEEIQNNGYKYIYNSNAKVYHSHNEPASRFAYRLWELHRKDVRIGKIRPGMFYVIYATAAIAKRRLTNIIKYKNPLITRIRGFISLFPEILFFIIIAVLERCGVSHRNVRKRMWK